MPANHTPTPAQSWIVRLARVCWERKKLSVIVVVASVSTILLAALTPLLTRQAVNDALAGNPARLPWLACGLLLIAFFDFIGNYVRRGYAGMLSLWVQHTLRGRVFDSIQKLDGAGQDALRTGQVISRTNSDLQQGMHLLQIAVGTGNHLPGAQHRTGLRRTGKRLHPALGLSRQQGIPPAECTKPAAQILYRTANATP